jgi:anti-anti-sigma factor
VEAAALPAALGEDLQITLGEAAANAVEHAYAGTGKAGEFTYLVTRCGDGAIEVQVRDFGQWRAERANNFVRGRGLMIIREIGVDVVVEPSPAGTEVRFRLPAPPSSPIPETRAPAPVGQPQPPAVPAELYVHREPAGGRRLELRGELDLDSATRLNGPLLDQVHVPGPVILDLRAVDYLSSAGVGMLIDAVQRAVRHDLSVQLQLTPHSLAARVLALTGLEHALPLVSDATQPVVR